MLITPASYESLPLQNEIDRFEAVTRVFDKETAPVIPIIFGTDLASMMIDDVQMRRYILVERAVYDTRAFDSPEWERAVQAVRQALDAAAEGRPPQPPPDPPEMVLRRARIEVGRQGRWGWLLGDDLAVMSAASDLTEEAMEVRSYFGPTQALISPWLKRPVGGLRDLTLLRLNPVLELPQPFTVDPVKPGTAVEFYTQSLDRAVKGLIGDAASDRSFGLMFQEGEIRLGPAAWAVWDIEEGRYLGVSSRAAGGDFRIFSLMDLRELAGKPARSAAIRPPSAHIHDDSWTIEDRLDYALYGRAIKEFVEHPDTKPPLVIAVQGPWGQGKTSLMRIAQDRLDGQHADLVAWRNATASALEPPSELTLKDLRDSLDGEIEIETGVAAEVRSVWFNPWKYQSSEAIWAGLAHAILTQLPARLTRREQEMFWLKLQRDRIDPAAIRRDIHRLIFERLLPWLALAALVAVAFALACLIAGASAAFGAVGALAAGAATATASWLEVRRRALNGKLEGSYRRYVRQPEYEGKMGYFHHVEEDVRAALKLLTGESRSTVVFIDDLDRCGAAKISEVFEAINLFLSGDYPNCVFILGIDAQVVASAMETVHRQALGEDQGDKDDLKGNLGWRFLDKFIQLSFVMPRLSKRQQGLYLASLIEAPDGAGADRETGGSMHFAERVRRNLAAGRIGVEQAAKEVGGLTEETTSQRLAVQQIAEDVIALGARDFSDSDPEANESLRRRLEYLSDNPRTIKRAVNLYRFYRFIAWAREASASKLEVADPDLIASWTVIAARWPQVVHWLQTEGRDSPDPEGLLRKKWVEDEPDLGKFLTAERNLDLKEAMDCGLW
ncbi:MAG TPA: P-loop NTPase fold protein [Solirubrobacterales bacterium]|nr:P-loop NTPase fold protein [Solirubrobacterales bacterium]